MPKRQETVILETMSAARYLAIAAKAMKELGWNIISSSTTEVVAETPMSFMKNSWGEIISVYAINNTAEIISKSKGTILFDWGRNRKNINYLKGRIDTLAPYEPAETVPAEGPAGEVAAETEKEASQFVYARPQEHDSFLHFFIPRGNFFITPIIMELNILVFILMVASGVSSFQPNVEDLVRWGGDFKPLVLGGEWWRLITCVFVHSGIIHVAFNMYALFFIGVYLEPLLGRTRYAAAYLAAGIFSSLLSSWWHGDDFISVGASGAIFGLYGVFLALLTTNIVDQHARKSLLSSIGIFVAYNLFYGFRDKSVDNSAHLGGLLSGMLIGYVFYFTFREPSAKKNRNVSAGVVAAAVLVTVFYLTNYKDDTVRFEQRFNAFIQLQNDALAPLKDRNLSEAELSRQLQDISLADWKKAKLLIDSTMSLKLNTSLSQKRQLAMQYAALRVEQTNLLLESLRGDGVGAHQEEIDASVKKINSLVEEMNKY